MARGQRQESDLRQFVGSFLAIVERVRVAMKGQFSREQPCYYSLEMAWYFSMSFTLTPAVINYQHQLQLYQQPYEPSTHLLLIIYDSPSLFSPCVKETRDGLVGSSDSLSWSSGSSTASQVVEHGAGTSGINAEHPLLSTTSASWTSAVTFSKCSKTLMV